MNEFDAIEMPGKEGWMACYCPKENQIKIIINESIPIQHDPVAPMLFETKELAIEAAKNYNWSQKKEK